MRSVGCSAASQATATVSRCCGGSSCGQGRSSSHCHRDWNPSCGTSPSTMGRAVPAADSPCCWCGGGAWSSTGGCCSVDVDGGGCRLDLGRRALRRVGRSAWPATARCQSTCRKSSRTAPPRAFSTAKVWDHRSLGRRTSCRAPHQKCQKSRFAHTRRLWGHPTGRAAAMRRAVTRKITTGWATRAGPPSVWPPRFRHLESTILPRPPRPA